MKKIFLFFLPFFLYSQIIDTVIRFSDQPGILLYIPKENELYISFYWASRLLVMDCSTYEIKKVIQIPSNFGGDAFGAWNWRRDKIYFSFSPSPESMAVIDSRTDSLIKWIGGMVFYGAPLSVCYNSKEDKIYAVGYESLAVIDCEIDSIIKIIPPQPYPLTRFVLWDSIGNKVYCGSAWSDVVTVINCENDSVIKVIRTRSSTPCQATYITQHRKIYVIGYWGRYEAVICAVGDTLIKNFEYFFEEDYPPIYNYLEDKLYVCDLKTLFVIDCARDSVIKRIVPGSDIFTMCFLPWSNRLYFTTTTWEEETFSSFITLYVLDCRNDSIISQIRFGGHGFYMVANPLTHQVYLTDINENALYVLRDEIGGIEEHTEKKSFKKLRFYPYRDKIVISYSTTIPSFVEISIYDLNGQRIKKLYSGKCEKGDYKIIWDKTDYSGRKVPSGIYFIMLNKENSKERLKVIIN
jgi:YVTN family beta-propeller protein